MAALKPYHHGDLRDALLQAGEQALADLPLAEVSLREIARRAGVSHAAPKHHFGTLGELLGEIAARGFDQFVKTLATAANQAPEQTPESRMHAMMRAYLRFAEAQPAAYGLMFGRANACAMTPHLVAAKMAAWEQLEDGVAAIVGPLRAVAGAALVWSSVHGLASLRLDRRLPPQIDPHQAIEQVGRMVIAGLRADAL